MFCKNCGSQMADKAVICVKCGVYAGAGRNFCPGCGKPTNPLAVICVNCGIALSQNFGQNNRGGYWGRGW